MHSLWFQKALPFFYHENHEKHKNEDDFETLQFPARGENSINGFRNRNLREYLYGTQTDSKLKKSTSAKISRRLRLLRAHGLIKKVTKTNRYVLTTKGTKIATAVLAASHVDTEQLMDMTG